MIESNHVFIVLLWPIKRSSVYLFSFSSRIHMLTHKSLHFAVRHLIHPSPCSSLHCPIEHYRRRASFSSLLSLAGWLAGGRYHYSNLQSGEEGLLFRWSLPRGLLSRAISRSVKSDPQPPLPPPRTTKIVSPQSLLPVETAHWEESHQLLLLLLLLMTCLNVYFLQ